MRTAGCVSSWALASALFLSPVLARAAEEPARPYPACDRTPTEGDVAAAKGAFQAGNGSFNEADYDRAIVYWEDAYRRDCTAHPLLLNLARAYELNGQKRHAVVALQTFLARNPNSSEESQIKRRIEKLEEQISNEAPAAATAPPAATPETAPPAAASQEDSATPARQEPAPESPGTRSKVPFIVVGAGGAIAIVGGIIFLKANSDLKHYENDVCPNRNCGTNKTAQDEANAVRTRYNVSGVVTLAGLGVAAGGLIWYFVSKPKPAETATLTHGFRPSFAPAVGVGYGGVEMSGSF